jgi:hypothetical protein
MTFGNGFGSEEVAAHRWLISLDSDGRMENGRRMIHALGSLVIPENVIRALSAQVARVESYFDHLNNAAPQFDAGIGLS